MHFLLFTCYACVVCFRSQTPNCFSCRPGRPNAVCSGLREKMFRSVVPSRRLRSAVMRHTERKRNSDSRVIFFRCCSFFLLLPPPASCCCCWLLLLLVLLSRVVRAPLFFLCSFAPSSSLPFLFFFHLFSNLLFRTQQESKRKFPLARTPAEQNPNQNGLHTPSGQPENGTCRPRRRIGTSLFHQPAADFSPSLSRGTRKEKSIRGVPTFDGNRPLLPVSPKRKPRPAATKANIYTLHTEFRSNFAFFHSAWVKFSFPRS